MKNLLDLADSLEEKAKKLEANTSKISVEVALTIVGSLAYSTPVDTSQAVSNYIVTLGAPYNGSPIDPHYPGEKGSTRQMSAAETIQAAKKVLANKKPKQDIYITNTAPQTYYQNYGTTRLPALGFVEKSVMIGKQVFKKKMNLLE